MAKTSHIDVPDELKNLQRKSVEQRDRFSLGVVQGAKSLPSRRRKKAIKELSLFGFLATLWRELTDEQKDVWRQAAALSSLNNWQLFVSDNAARIRHDLDLSVPPSELWQVRAGHLTINSPASEIILKQIHPFTFYEAQKVPGASHRRELVQIEEKFTLPLSLGIRYKADLTAEGGEQSARYFARVWHSIQGQDIFTDFGVDFNPSTDWEFLNAVSPAIDGIRIGYELFIEIKGYRGELFFDNIRAEHSGTNWARDPRADEINKEFSGAFSAVPPFWIPVSVPEGSNFESVFPPAVE